MRGSSQFWLSMIKLDYLSPFMSELIFEWIPMNFTSWHTILDFILNAKFDPGSKVKDKNFKNKSKYTGTFPESLRLPNNYLAKTAINDFAYES